jgi:hypothetical protein
MMIGFVGLSIDAGKVAWNIHQMHVAADAGALAGAQVVKYDRVGAIQRAHDFAFSNTADQLPVDPDTVGQSDPLSGDEEIILGRWVYQERQFYPTIFGANAVKVIAKRQAALGARAPALDLLFGPIFGTDSVDAERHAIAWSRVSTGAGIICLADDPYAVYKDYGWNNQETGLLINGGCDIDLTWTDPETGEVIYGDIQVNAVSMDVHNKAALVKTGVSGLIYAGEINVVGWSNPEPTTEEWAQYYGETGLPFSVNTYPVTSRVEDPLLYLNDPPHVPVITEMTLGPILLGTGETLNYAGTITNETIELYGEPVIDPATGLPTGEKVLTLLPGWYPGGINITEHNIVLTGGADAVYAFGGGDVLQSNPAPGLCLNGGSIIGEGVMVYITGDPDSGIKYGRIDIGGSAHCELTSRGDVPLEGFGVEGTDGMVLWQDINNHNQANIIGTAESFLKGTMYFPDNPAQVGGGTDQLGAQIICGALQINGNVDLGIAYDGRNQITAQVSALVE